MSNRRVSESEKDFALDLLAYELAECAHKYLRPAFHGDVVAAFRLVFAANPGYERDWLVAEAYRLQMPPRAFKKLLDRAVTHFSGVGLLELVGGRRRFTDMCKYAGLDLPDSIPARPTIYRGVEDMSPEEGANGLHWSLSFGCAAFFATRFRKSNGIVLKATIHRASIVFHSADRNEDEVIPEKAPDRFEVIEDYDKIAEAAALHRASMSHAVGAGGTCIGSSGLSELSSAGRLQLPRF